MNLEKLPIVASVKRSTPFRVIRRPTQLATTDIELKSKSFHSLRFFRPLEFRLMSSESFMTADQFTARRHELPDGGRWHELHEGQTVMLEAPDDAHGTAVLNIAKALARWFQNNVEQKVGYACADLGLKVSDNTVYFPALCFFDQGAQFAESDHLVAQSCPRLVIDVASSVDRRREMRLRTLAYQKLGVETIWVPDPTRKEILILQKGGDTLCLGERQTIQGNEILPKFELRVPDVFAQPEWWK